MPLRDVEPVTRTAAHPGDDQRRAARRHAALSLTGADGIGLFRTEFQFLVSATLPQRERQTRLYRDVLDAAGDKPVIFRTVDIGGDKALPYLRQDDRPRRRRTRRWAGARCAWRSSAKGC
jgi:phosphotransferase system, enzyme I, PtsP